MKELLHQTLILRQSSVSTLNGVEGLTTQPPMPYSKGGEIFMPENNGEIQQSQEGGQKPVEKIEQKPSKGESKGVSQERIEAASRAAIEAYGDLEKLPFETRQTVEEMIRRGFFPVEGGAEQQSLTGEPTPPNVPPPPTETGGAGSEEPPIEPSEEGFWRQLNTLLNNESVRIELEKDTPDFTKPELKSLKNFIEALNPADQRGIMVIFAEIITQKKIGGIKNDKAGINIPEINISDESRKVIFEWLLERIISIPDTTPDTPYMERLSSFYITSNLANLLEVARRNFPETKDIAYFGDLTHVRQTAHEFNRSLRFGESYKSFVTEHIRAHGLNFMRNEVAGVATAVQFYEKVAAQRVSKTKEWFNDGDIKAIEEKVEKLFTDLVEDGSVRKDGRKLLEWEKNRALRLAKIFFAGTQRLAVYTSFGDLPSDAKTTDRLASLPYEYIARAIVPWKMIAPRFFASAGGPKKYMDMIFEEQEEQLGELETKPIGLFGVDKRTVMMNTYGAQDPESHSWRSQMMFLGNIRLKGVVVLDREGRKVSAPNEMSLLEYLNAEAKIYGGTVEDPVLGGKGVDKRDKKLFPKFKERISEAILGQRLYLTVLARYGNLDDSLREKVWQKIAILKPSTLVSLCPEIVKNKIIWEGMMDKLYKAEMKRVLEEGEKTNEKGEKMTLREEELREEGKNFRGILDLASLKERWTEDQRLKVLEYMGMKGLNLNREEWEELETIIKNGVDASKRLASAKLPFTFAIDDAPVVSWSKTREGITGLSDEDVIRILISDQENFKNAWNEINAQVESPQYIEQTIEHFMKAVKGIADVIGRAPAQEVIEPFVTAWVKMASTFSSVLWVPGAKTIGRLTRTPTSEMEKYFRNAFLSLDEEERRNVLQAISQVGALSDSPAEKDSRTGLTQLDKVMEKTKSSKKWSHLAIFRIILFLLGPAFASEFLKSLPPKELKS